MKKTTLAHAAAVMAALASSGVYADGPDLKFSGYGTAAAAFTNNSDLQFRSGLSRSKGVSNTIDLGNDSRFGLQGAAVFSDKISVTGQVVAQRHMTGATTSDIGKDKDFDPAVEWFYVQYNALPSLNLRLGRTALNAFLLSDSLNVGYAAPWLRAPLHLYASQALSRLDGAQGNWRDSVGGFNLSAQASYGKSEQPIYSAPGGGVLDLNAKNVYGLNFVVEHGNWLGRVGTVKGNTPGPFGTVHDSYQSAGIQYDDGQLLVMAEYAKRAQNKFVQLGNVALIQGNYSYVATGYRFGPVMPTIIWSRGREVFSDFHGGTAGSKHQTPSLALRYDVAPNVDLKVQFDRYDATDEQAFVTPLVNSNAKVSVFTAGADFVF